ncbi:Ubiquitin-like-specific protease ESD4 [Apostasia shenzhenica]|uniref:Ubiquitin-like-specific protease ESD4 n=1 Tax=Apostasia shenzhenica TaxID=1088818 RepID=A0A2I0ASA2_9ASPA|nr:Ubiquitin-like-specific protease ESD4 [Apostasia shenzhenica]
MGALTDHRKRCLTDFRLPPSSLSSPPEKKARLPPQASSHSAASSTASSIKTATSPPNVTFPPRPSTLTRPVHAPQRIIRVFGLGTSSTTKSRPSSTAEMGNFFSHCLRRKQDDKLALEEYKKLVEELCASPGEATKVSPAPQKASSPVVSDLTILTKRDEEILASSHVLNWKVENARKVYLESVPVREGWFSVQKEPVYKELYQQTKTRDSRLNELAFETKLAQQTVTGCRFVAEELQKSLQRPKKDLEGLLRSLSDDDENEISLALHRSNSHNVLVSHQPSNIEITGKVLQCLNPGAWLNDEVINLYLELLKEREKRVPKKFLKCHFFNTFFYKKLTSGTQDYDFKAVRRWTTQRKLGYALIDCDKIFVPVHKEIHWCLAVINVKDNSFQYLDSLGGMDNFVLTVLARYFKDEMRDKSAMEIDTTSWKKESIDKLPLQKNGWDCGMFMLKYTDFYSRGLEFSFSQEHMPYFRKRTALEILRLKAE